MYHCMNIFKCVNEYLILEHPSELYPSIMRLNFANSLLKPTAYSLLNARPKYRILVPVFIPILQAPSKYV